MAAPALVVWHVDSSSLTREPVPFPDQASNPALCIGSAKSWPLDHHKVLVLLSLYRALESAGELVKTQVVIQLSGVGAVGAGGGRGSVCLKRPGDARVVLHLAY